MYFDPTCKPETKIDAAGRHLLAAADYIEKHGHCKGDLKDDRGRVCVLGALAETGMDDWYGAAAARLRIHIGVEYIGFWNNAPERTAAEVVAAMRAAASRS